MTIKTYKYCDVCNRTIDYSKNTTIEMKLAGSDTEYNNKFFETNYDVCQICAKKISDFIKELKV